MSFPSEMSYRSANAVSYACACVGSALLLACGGVFADCTLFSSGSTLQWNSYENGKPLNSGTFVVSAAKGNALTLEQRAANTGMAVATRFEATINGASFTALNKHPDYPETWIGGCNGAQINGTVSSYTFVIKLVDAAPVVAQSTQATQAGPTPLRDGSDRNSQTTVEALDLSAKAAIARRDLDEAIRIYSRAIAIAGGTAKRDRSMLYSNRGWAWNGKMDYNRAMADFDEAIRLDSQNAFPYLQRSVAWWNRDNNYERAAADLKQAIRLDSKRETDAVNRLAKLEQIQRETGGAAASNPASPLPATQGPVRYEQPDYMKRAQEARKQQNAANCERAYKGANTYCSR